jgi:hypothetical protein
MIDRARQEALAAPSPAAAAPAPARAVKPTNQLPAEGDSTLVPMLISGLVLVVIAMIGVMMFA